MKSHIEYGKDGEIKAQEFFISHGFSILCKNYRLNKLGEIDLIVGKDNLIVFCEVKTRHSESYGGPLYAITKAKLKRMRIVADSYILKNLKGSDTDATFRFDLLAVTGEKMEWIQDILR